VPRLTDTVIKQADVRAKQYEKKCSDHKGLRIVIWPSGNRTFVFRYTFGGKYKKITLGEYGANAMTLAKAHAAYTAARDALDAGRDPAAVSRMDANADDTLAAYLAIYERDHVSTMRPGTQTYVKAELARFQTICAGKKLAEVTKADVHTAIADARKRGPSAAVTAWKVTRGFLAWCEGSLPIEYTSPAHKVPKPAKEPDRDRVLTDAELKTVWRAADAAGQQFGALVKLLLLTGCRRNEIAELQWSEVGTDAIELPGERTKNGERHTVPMTRAIRAVLDTLPKGGKYVLRRPGYPDRPFTGFSKAKDTFGDGLADWRLHDLRRSFASGLQRLGILPHIIERCINHQSGELSGIRKVYQRDKHAAEVKAAFEKWSAHVESLVTEKVKAAA
jgi:integrase